MDVKTTLHYPVSTRRRVDVHTTSKTLKQRRMDVKTTLCAYWVLTIMNVRVGYRGKSHMLEPTLDFAARYTFSSLPLSTMMEPPDYEPYLFLKKFWLQP